MARARIDLIRATVLVLNPPAFPASHLSTSSAESSRSFRAPGAGIT